MAIIKNYKRQMPRRYNHEIQHTCYEHHDCEERWTVGHHLAEALYQIEIYAEISQKSDFFTLDFSDIKHHILKAWDKSK